jgi:hypothetical protein
LTTLFGTHSLRRTKATLIYRRTGISPSLFRAAAAGSDVTMKRGLY